jgi:hypothetical protein
MPSIFKIPLMDEKVIPWKQNIPYKYKCLGRYEEIHYAVKDIKATYLTLVIYKTLLLIGLLGIKPFIKKKTIHLMLKLHIKVSDLSIYSICLMRVFPPVRAQNAAFAVVYGPRTCHQSCL